MIHIGEILMQYLDLEMPDLYSPHICFAGRLFFSLNRCNYLKILLRYSGNNYNNKKKNTRFRLPKVVHISTVGRQLL